MDSFKKGTKAVWAGEGNIKGINAVKTPIINSVAFAYNDLEEWYDVSKGNKEGFIYSRNTNPTVAALEEKIRVLEGAKACDVVYLETPTNPTLKVLDIERLSKAAKAVGAIVLVDNTFATPINQNPLQLGADLVLHSATKYLCGHSDALGGLLAGKKELVQKVFQFREINGASLQADPAYMIARGMKTLELRIERQNESALKIAQYLKGHAKVKDVFYPGLSTHPGHEIAKKQMQGFGGMMSFSLKGGWEAVKKFLPALKLAHLAASLGSVSTLAGPPRTTSHVELTEEQRRELGIPESLIRYSVGIENADDLINDLEEALKK